MTPPFAPAGRRWPEGSDEGAARHILHCCPSLTLSAFAALPLTPSSACRHLLPAGEKGNRGGAAFIFTRWKLGGAGGAIGPIVDLQHQR
ncbi:hypothetical protein RCCGE510_19819 [Rhizobium sp. CCGE 510]|nr:hypothetical protein RCCGE510_19819 [Rhizobium sp. CCGE 510]